MRYYQASFTLTYWVAAENEIMAEDEAYDLAREQFGKIADDMGLVVEEVSKDEAAAMGFDFGVTL